MKFRKYCPVHKRSHSSHSEILCQLMHALNLKDIKESEIKYKNDVNERKEEIKKLYLIER